MVIEKSRKEVKQYITNLEVDLQKIVDERKKEMKECSLAEVDPHSPSDFEKMSHTEIYYYVECLKNETDRLQNMVESNIIWWRNTYDTSEVWEARKIILDWKKLHDHLEDNPSIKEEWEALLMAIKLTEDE